MVKAVRFDEYGDVDVLNVVDVAPPSAGPGEVVVRVRAAGINPGEAKIRQGLLDDVWPATFPSGQGSDLAGVVETVGAGVEAWAVGDEVFGYTDTRGSQAELVAVKATNLARRPAEVPWEVAGSLFVAGATAWAAIRAVAPEPGDTVVVTGAAGGVGSLAVQLAVAAGATVLGLASAPNHAWLRDHGVVPVIYGDGVADRIRDAADGPVDAWVDLVGGGYVDLALELGVDPSRIDTIVDWATAQRVGAKTDGNAGGSSATVLDELAQMVASGRLDVVIAGTYPLAEVRAAYRELEQGHTHGKLVLLP